MSECHCTQHGVQKYVYYKTTEFSYILYTDTVESSDWLVIEVVCLLVVAEDEEQFEDNPEEYIRRDIEGSGKLPFVYCL